MRERKGKQIPGMVQRLPDKFAAGDGTQGNPFQIETAAQLAYFAKTVNEGEAYLHKYIVLTADIDLANKEWNTNRKL